MPLYFKGINYTQGEKKLQINLEIFYLSLFSKYIAVLELFYVYYMIEQMGKCISVVSSPGSPFT